MQRRAPGGVAPGIERVRKPGSDEGVMKRTRPRRAGDGAIARAAVGNLIIPPFRYLSTGPDSGALS